MQGHLLDIHDFEGVFLKGVLVDAAVDFGEGASTNFLFDQVLVDLFFRVSVGRLETTSCKVVGKRVLK